MSKKQQKPFVSVIVPAYRQEKTIVQDLKRIQSALENARFGHEIICVVDGKVDRSFAKAKRLSSKKLKVVGYPSNRGKGYAVRFGMARSKGDLIAFIDAGMEINPEGIGLMLEHMLWYDSDVIVGSIRHSASKVYGYPLKRKVYSFVYHMFTKHAFGLKITDSQRGLKIFKREVLEKVLPRLLVKRYAFDIEILAVARRLGFSRIHDGPVEMDASKMKYSSVTSATVLNMLKDTLAVFYRLHLLHYYDDENKRKWEYDPELDMKINLG